MSSKTASTHKNKATQAKPRKKLQTTSRATAKTTSPAETSHSNARQLVRDTSHWYQPKTWRNRYPTYKPLPKARFIMRTALQALRAHPKTFLGISTVYGLGTLLLVRGFSIGQDILTLKAALDNLLTGASGKAQSLFLQLTFLFGNSNGTQGQEGAVYQTILLVVCSLALIWALRMVYAKKNIGVKKSFYQGMHPLIPFLLVLGVIGLQLLPLSLASLIYNLLIASGTAVHAIEQIPIIIVCIALALWSLRMLTSSIFALYIVTLRDMEPLHALKSAKNLVGGRRLLIWRKLLFLPLAIAVATSLVVLPFLLFLTPLAPWVFFLSSLLWLPIAHSFLYALYRELLA